MSAFTIKKSNPLSMDPSYPLKNPTIEESASTGITARISQAVQDAIKTLKEKFTPTNVLLGTCLAIHAVAIKYPNIVVQGLFHLPSILEGEVWRLGTFVVLHANLIHLFANMYVLSKRGPEFEKIWGARGFVQITAIATAANAIALAVISPAAKSLGFSGVICGMEAALTARSLKEEGKGIQPILIATGSFVAKEIITSVAVKIILGMNISLICHFSGFAAGFVFGWLSTPSTVSSTLAKVQAN